MYQLTQLTDDLHRQRTAPAAQQPPAPRLPAPRRATPRAGRAGRRMRRAVRQTQHQPAQLQA